MSATLIALLTWCMGAFAVEEDASACKSCIRSGNLWCENTGACGESIDCAKNWVISSETACPKVRAVRWMEMSPAVVSCGDCLKREGYMWCEANISACYNGKMHCDGKAINKLDGCELPPEYVIVPPFDGKDPPKKYELENVEGALNCFRAALKLKLEAKVGTNHDDALEATSKIHPNGCIVTNDHHLESNRNEDEKVECGKNVNEMQWHCIKRVIIHPTERDVPEGGFALLEIGASEEESPQLRPSMAMDASAVSYEAAPSAGTRLRREPPEYASALLNLNASEEKSPQLRPSMAVDASAVSYEAALSAGTRLRREPPEYASALLNLNASEEVLLSSALVARTSSSVSDEVINVANAAPPKQEAAPKGAAPPKQEAAPKGAAPPKQEAAPKAAGAANGTDFILIGECEGDAGLEECRHAALVLGLDVEEKHEPGLPSGCSVSTCTQKVFFNRIKNPVPCSKTMFDKDANRLDIHDCLCKAKLYVLRDHCGGAAAGREPQVEPEELEGRFVPIQGAECDRAILELGLRPEQKVVSLACTVTVDTDGVSRDQQICRRRDVLVRDDPTKVPAKPQGSPTQASQHDAKSSEHAGAGSDLQSETLATEQTSRVVAQAHETEEGDEKAIPRTCETCLYDSARMWCEATSECTVSKISCTSYIVTQRSACPKAQEPLAATSGPKNCLVCLEGTNNMWCGATNTCGRGAMYCPGSTLTDASHCSMPQFSRVGQGECSNEATAGKLKHIRNKERCDLAAKTLKLGSPAAQDANEPNYPTGCSYASVGSLYFEEKDSDIKCGQTSSDGTGKHDCLCESPYSLRKHDLCSSAAMDDVSSAEDCQAAAQILGLSGGVEVSDARTQPHGCLLDGDKLRFNDVGTSWGLCGSVQCICKAKD